MAKSDEVKKAWVEWALVELNPIRFKGALMYSAKGTNGFNALTRRSLADRLYSEDVSMKPSVIDHVLDALLSVAPDWSDHDRYIAFYDQVWDMKKLEFTPGQLEFVYSTSIKLQPAGSKGYEAAMTFLLELSLGDAALAHDYLQAIAPLVMYTRPAGVIWFIGDGANGKSSLINALYRVFGQFFASMTTAMIEDGRDTPSLNGILGNIVREGSEARIEDSASYKAIGTHEPFRVHKFHSQESTEIQTNFHTIFNANNIPVFADKTKGARRRTLPVPFPAHFKDNPTFEDETFTPEFLGGLMTLVLEESVKVRDNGTRYDWSGATTRLKQSYDSEVNSAEAFISHVVSLGIVGFINYKELKWRYETWCDDNGLVALGKNNLRHTVEQATGAKSKPVRIGEKTSRRFFFADAFDGEDKLVWFDTGYGMPTPKEAIPAPTPIANERISREW